jgi:hypothetical protein
VQREEVAIEIAKRARATIQIERGIVQPVQPKLLVPLVEKGSCEDPQDTVMIDRWANLLAAASLKLSVQPRFVSILEELSGSQAECLEHVAFHDFEDFRFPYAIIVDCPYTYAEHDATRDLQEIVAQNLKSKKDVEKTLEAILSYAIERVGDDAVVNSLEKRAVAAEGELKKIEGPRTITASEHAKLVDCLKNAPAKGVVHISPGWVNDDARQIGEQMKFLMRPVVLK